MRTATARRAALGVIAAAAVVVSTGCSAINYQATTHEYSASDGVMADAGDVQLRHITLIASEEGGPARLIGLVKNGGSETADIDITVEGETFSFSLEPGESANLEHDEELVVSAVGVAPGSMQEVSVSVNGTAEELSATVLDGTLAEYRALLPDGFDQSAIDHLEHGPDTWGSGAAHHSDDDDDH